MSGKKDGRSANGVGRREFLTGTTALGLTALGVNPALARVFDSPLWKTPADETHESSVLGEMCRVNPERGQGPFYLDLSLLRSDIAEDRAGLPLSFFVEVVDADGCRPISDVVVDVWQADADGDYSGVDGNEETWLRGIQVTGANGRVRFETIYPGWYPGRTAHIHLKGYIGATDLVTTQLFFPQNITDLVYSTMQPYTENGPADTPNTADGAYDVRNEMRVIRNPDGSMSAWAGIRLGVEL